MADGIRWVGLDVHATPDGRAVFDTATGEVRSRKLPGRPHEVRSRKIPADRRAPRRPENRTPQTLRPRGTRQLTRPS